VPAGVWARPPKRLLNDGPLIESDLERLRAIGRLLETGLNLAGIEMVLQLQEANEQLRLQIESLESHRKK